MDKPPDPDMRKQVRHEIRRPLISLINTADLLLAGLEGELSEPVRHDIETMKANAEDALARIDVFFASTALEK